MSNLRTTQEIYQAFGRGDVPAILAKLSDSVDWDYGPASTDVPWLQRRKGRDGAASFFASLEAIQIHTFAPKTFLESEGLVVALVDIEFTVKATGKRVVEEDEVHIWRFDAQGKVARFRHRSDTHQHHLAYHK
jgi:ketosteroid isomerase-like protein